MKFSEWLLRETTITRLAIFDFDSTLANTPLQPQGWKGQPYQAPDGQTRDGGDWWAHPDSLQEYEFNQKILAEFQRARNEPHTKAVLLTGRPGMRTAHLIRGKLRQNGLYGKRMIAPGYTKAIERAQKWPHGDDHKDDAHEEYYKGDWNKAPDFPKGINGSSSSDTLDHKQYIVEKLIDGNITEIDFWDDRVEHFDSFMAMFKRLLVEKPNLQRVNYHHVQNGQVRTIPLQKART